MFTGAPHQGGFELSTDLEGEVTFQAPRRTLSAALSSMGEQAPLGWPLLWISAPNSLKQNKGPCLRPSHPYTPPPSTGQPEAAVVTPWRVSGPLVAQYSGGTGC